MPQYPMSPQSTYMIQYPNARVEAIAQETSKVLSLAIETPDRDSAIAATLFMQLQTLPLLVWTTAVEQALTAHHPHPESPDIPESQRLIARDLISLTEKYGQVLEAKFPEILQDPATPVTSAASLTLTLFQDLALAHAAQCLNGEIISRPLNDPTGKAYRRALADHATERARPETPPVPAAAPHRLSGRAAEARETTNRIISALQPATVTPR